MGHIKPQPKILFIWRAWLALVMLLPAFLNSLLFRIGGPLWWGITTGWLAVFFFGYLYYLPTRLKRLSYSLSGDRVMLQSGVFYNRERMMPLRNIQYTSVQQTPLDKLCGLCTLVVVAAGGRLSLPGLRTEEAEALARALGDFSRPN